MASETVAGSAAAAPSGEAHELQRTISWTHAFWVASGVPALVLFSIGAISATVGAPSPLVWFLSVLFGFLQAFTYAEIAGMYPEKSGGASVYGAMAWVRYSKLIAPLSVWCNWFAWSPVLAIGTGLAAGYILTSLFPPDAVINTWSLTLIPLGFIKEGLTLRISAQSILGALVLLGVFAMQHHGILRAARLQKIAALSALIPLMLVGIVPLITGDIPSQNFTPFVPLQSITAQGNVVPGSWDGHGWTLFMGGLFIAAWSAYAFETAVCYTREFKEPEKDTFKSIFYSGLLCIAVYTLVPFSFQGFFGPEGLVTPGIANGTGVASSMAEMVGGGAVIENILVVMLILALLLAIMTSMAGSSRTLYQGGLDGWLPRYLGKANEHGAPTRAMWTDLGFNMILLLMSNYVFLLAASNVTYIIFNFLNLNAGWIHRMDRPDWYRPYRAPTWLLGVGVVLSFVNATLLGVGAGVWGQNTLLASVIFAALILPVFWFRHYVQDGGKFPEAEAEALAAEEKVQLRAGYLPYVVIALGVAVVLISRQFAVY
ncbi:MAG TPA: APC family permease [Gammaproteobacteria bacterium]|nr:APC family permease [Gammaproteobacteria bacterium]